MSTTASTAAAAVPRAPKKDRQTDRRRPQITVRVYEYKGGRGGLLCWDAYNTYLASSGIFFNFGLKEIWNRIRGKRLYYVDRKLYFVAYYFLFKFTYTFYTDLC